MATLPKARLPHRPSSQARVRSLLRLNDAVRKISSILELSVLLDKIVNDVAAAFGCLESMILLKDRDSNYVTVAAVMGCSQVMKQERYKVAEEGLVGWVAATGLPLYTPDVRKEPRYIACEPETRSELDLPLIAHGDVIGVFSTQHPEVDGFPAEQRALLEALAGHIAVAIDNAQVFQRERAEKERMQHQEAEAHRIQQALFPKVSPRIPGFQVDGHCLPAGAVGGDFYDFISVGDSGAWGLVLADVSGKGMAAALLMSATRAILRSVAKYVQAPAEVLKRVNLALLDDLPPEQFVTMVYAILDPARRTLTYANAGHPYPILADGHAPRYLKTQMGLPLGIAPCEYDQQVVPLPSDARLLLYSDGVSEAADIGDEEEYGLERLKAQLTSGPLSAEGVLRVVCSYRGDRPLADDATVITVNGTA